MPSSSVADIRNSFGAAFVGLLVNTTLFGLTIVQTWIYFWNYRNRDPRGLKFFVAFITVMDALHTAICAYSLYWYLILNFGNLENLAYTMWAMNLQVIIGILIGAPVQCYYARRVYIMSKSIICPIIIVAIVAAGSALGIFFMAKETVLKQFSKLHPLTWVTCTGMTIGAVADLLISASMCWSLYRRRTGFARTDSTIMTLMAYSVNSGLLVSFLSAGMIISFALSPSSLVWLAMYWTMTKCYVNSLLAMFNSRDYIRDRSVADNPENPINLSSIPIDSSSNGYGSKSGVSVTMHRMTFGRNNDVVEPTFAVPKQSATVIDLKSQDQTSEPNV